MKKSLLFLLFLAFSTAIVAQQTARVVQLGNQKRTETYVNPFGKDSIKFTILGQKDTILTEEYYANGRIDTKIWTNDSIHVFDNVGRLREIYYAADKTTAKLSVNYAPSISYYFNGEVEKRFHKTPTGNSTDIFQRNGDFIARTVQQQLGPKTLYKVKMDKQGKIVSAMKADTLSVVAGIKTYIIYDTLFYPNGRVSSISHEKKIRKPDGDIGRSRLTEQYYNQDGTLRVALLPDSLDLIPFKDNVDCYYGLKNERGDTIYPARFDRIQNFSDNFWLAHQGTQVIFMRKDGKILSHVPINNIYSLNWSEDRDNYYSSRNREAYLSDTWTYPRRPTPYFGFESDGKHGVIDRNGLILMPPQYPLFDGINAAGSLLSIEVRDKQLHSVLAEHIIDRKGNYVPNNIYPSVNFTNVPNFFSFSKTSPADTSRWHYRGLMNQSGEVLLEDVYVSVSNSQLSTNNKFLWVKKGKESRNYNGDKDFSDEIYGLYDPENRRWVLPCIYKQTHENNQSEMILTDTFTKKSGIVSRSGEILLPFVYDTIDRFNGANICILNKNGQYQVYDVTRRRIGKETYQKLVLNSISDNYYSRFSSSDYQSGSCGGPVIPLIMAQKNSKWGILDLNGTVILPLIYDYAGSYGTLAFVKNNEADIISGSFFPDPKPQKKDIYQLNYNSEYYFRYDYEQFLTTYRLIGSNNEEQQFVVDSLRHVLLPPQYESIQSQGDWEILEDKAANRLILFKNEGEVEPFPYSKTVKWVDYNVPTMVLANEEGKGFEILNRRTGQVYQNFDGGAFVIVNDEIGTYFVKTDTPSVAPIENREDLPRVCGDTFLIDDSNWRLYDSMGKSLNINAFRYPIAFDEGIGIGTIGEKFGVWRLDGSVVIPPQYVNARWRMDRQRIIAYESRGLKTWLLLFDRTGKTLVNAGRYDGISSFYGKYALVSLGDKTGLIDSMGVEIIAPASLDNDQFNLRDSLNLVNVEYLKMMKEKYEDFLGSRENTSLPISIYKYKDAHKGTPIHPDSLALPNALRNRLWQYLLQTQVEQEIDKADFKRIYRAEAFKTYDVYIDYCPTINPTNTLRYVFVDSLHISFALLSDSAAKSNFTNYWKTKTGWKRQQLSDILILNRDNILKINALMTEKLRQLADKSIDCGESSSFIERTQNTFLTTPNGLNFYFTSNEKDPDAWSLTNYVPILLTWAELKPFRTPQ